MRGMKGPCVLGVPSIEPSLWCPGMPAEALLKNALFYSSCVFVHTGDVEAVREHYRAKYAKKVETVTQHAERIAKMASKDRTEGYVSMRRLLAEMDLESAEAEALRNELDAWWHAMTDEEIAATRKELGE